MTAHNHTRFLDLRAAVAPAPRRIDWAEALRPILTACLIGVICLGGVAIAHAGLKAAVEATTPGLPDGRW